MDEPFAALDAITRKNLQNLTKDICKKYNLTVLFVTHSVEEAVLLGDRIVIMDAKKHGINQIIDNKKEEISSEELINRVSKIIETLNEQK